MAAVAMAMAAPAWATPSATVTVAPISSGSFFVTITDTGPETITGYIVTPPEEPFAINAVTGQVCQFQPFLGALRRCAVTVAPATSAQICFAGSAPELYPGLEIDIQPPGGLFYRIKASESPAVPACPFPQSGRGSGSASPTSAVPGSGSGGGSSATPVTTSKETQSKGAHSWSRARCKGTYKAWAKTHRRATRLQKKAEASKLHKTHGCPLSILK